MLEFMHHLTYFTPVFDTGLSECPVPFPPGSQCAPIQPHKTVERNPQSMPLPQGDCANPMEQV